jgi:hypothetical protein
MHPDSVAGVIPIEQEAGDDQEDTELFAPDTKRLEHFCLIRNGVSEWEMPIKAPHRPYLGAPCGKTVVTIP